MENDETGGNETEKERTNTKRGLHGQLDLEDETGESRASRFTALSQ